MTHDEMAAELREYGWKVQEPADLRVAGPWERQKTRAWSRTWEGSTSPACYISRESRCGCKCHPCGDHLPYFDWRVGLLNASRYSKFRAQGRCDSLEEAQEAADEKLLALLRESREDRLARVDADPYTPTDKLRLDS